MMGDDFDRDDGAWFGWFWRWQLWPWRNPEGYLWFLGAFLLLGVILAGLGLDGHLSSDSRSDRLKPAGYETQTKIENCISKYGADFDQVVFSPEERRQLNDCLEDAQPKSPEGGAP